MFFNILLPFVSSILFFSFVRKFFKNCNQPQRSFMKDAEYKTKFQPIPCAGIIFFTLYTVYAFLNDTQWHVYCTVVGFFTIGLLDDIGKIVNGSHISYISGKKRFLLEILFSSVFAYFFLQGHNYDILVIGKIITIPYFLAFFIIIFLIVGTANAVNLTDGHDGLAGTVILLNLLFILMVAGFSSIVLALIVSLLAFLLFNSKPATIYMGDSGSMFFGSLLAILFIEAKAEHLLPITGFVFVFETVSVILQVLYFKATKGKRIFKMAPFHHHLSLSGVQDEKIVSIAFVTTSLLCLCVYCIFYVVS